MEYNARAYCVVVTGACYGVHVVSGARDAHVARSCIKVDICTGRPDGGTRANGVGKRCCDDLWN